MQPTRVFLMGMPTMLRDVIRTLVAGDPALELAGESATADDEAFRAARSHVLVVGCDVLTEVAVEEMLRRDCRLRVVGVSTNGTSASLFEMRPHREPLRELGRDSLRSVLLDRGPGR